MALHGTTPCFDLNSFASVAGAGVILTGFQKRQQIFAQGDPAHSVGYVRKGTVKATLLSDQGKEAIIGIFTTGQFFGETGLDHGATRTSTIIALEDCQITFIQRDVILAKLGSEPAFAAAFVKHLVSRNVRLESDLIDQLLNSSEKRLARLLLLLAGDRGGSRPLPASLSQEVLADMIGTTRSRVSTFMKRFREQGLVRYDSGGQIRVCSNSLLTFLTGSQPHSAAADIGWNGVAIQDS